MEAEKNRNPRQRLVDNMTRRLRKAYENDKLSETQIARLEAIGFKWEPQSSTPLSETHPELTKQWHPTRNGVLMPKDVSAGSGKKVWWKCPTCGGEWEATVCNRAGGRGKKGHGCPYCVDKKVLPGFNDLETTQPELAKQWHPTRNGDLAPRDVTAGTTRQIWWRHWHKETQMWHEWERSVGQERKRKGKCPICSNTKVLPGFNDLETTQPELAKQWHPTKNGELTPRDVVAGSNKKVWWKCPTCGYEWEATIASRNKGTGCPVCAKEQYGASQKKPVVCNETDEMFANLAEAAQRCGRKGGGSRRYIAKAIKSDGTAYGYHWRYATEEEIAAHKAGEDSDGQGKE